MAAGPAGPFLEAHVGAQYLLPLLNSGEPRGMPGMTVRHVQFQRGDLDSPMDDVTVVGHDSRGAQASLQIQVKRSIEFTSADPNFKDVMVKACKIAASGFKEGSHLIAVAIGSASRIDRYVQAVLLWARQYQDPRTFFHRLNKAGAAHQKMRDFVATLTNHMKASGVGHDEGAVHGLLRRFQVLVFDAEQPGSLSNVLARDRSLALLAPEQAARAGELWEVLGQIALALDAAGGDIDATELRRRLTSEHSFQLAGDRRLRQARDRIAEQSDLALKAITTKAHGVHLDREPFVSASLIALEHGRYLELRGLSGVGKSGVLKALAMQVLTESRVIVLSPYRIAAGGWSAMRDQLGCSVRAEEFLADLAGDGGATIFIDGIDRFENPAERATVEDLIQSAARTPGFRVVATARVDFDAQASAWLPADALAQLVRAPAVVIGELAQEEVDFLREESPALMALLRPGHPAEKLVRNLYRLDRLAVASTEPGETYSEAQMAHQWWCSGDSLVAQGRLDCQRIIHGMAVNALASSAPTDTSARSAVALDELVASRTLRRVRMDYYEFAHDVLRDWAAGCLLYEEPERINSLSMSAPIPVHLARAMELVARLHVERHEDSTGWQQLLRRVSDPGSHGSWKRAVLLALCRSERATDCLTRCVVALLADDAALLREVIRVAIAVDSRSAAELWASQAPQVSEVVQGLVVPDGPSWQNLVLWTLAVADILPHRAVPEVIDLYRQWCMAYFGRDALSPAVVTQLYKWLVEVERIKHPAGETWLERRTASEKPGLMLGNNDENSLRQTFLMWCSLKPDLTDSYLRSLAAHPNNYEVFRALVKFTGSAAKAAPQALVDLFLKASTQNEGDNRAHDREVFSHWNWDYSPASPVRPPFLDLLRAAPDEGLRLVRSVVAYCVRRVTGGRQSDRLDAFVIPFPGGTRTFPWKSTYGWARQSPSTIVSSALMALEAWSHQRIESGEAVAQVLQDILGPEESSSAYLLVAVDVLLSHWPQSREHLWPLALSAELLAVDQDRFGSDHVQRSFPRTRSNAEPFSNAGVASLTSRRSRQLPLGAVVRSYGKVGPEEVRVAMRESLAAQMEALGPPDANCAGLADPRLATLSAYNELDPANYVQKGTDPDGQPVFEYVTPAAEVDIFRKLQERALHGQEEVNMSSHLIMALDGPQVREEVLSRALALLSGGASGCEDQTDDRWQRWRLAALLLRDGGDELRKTHSAWAREMLAEAAATPPSSAHLGAQIAYSPWAISAIGYLADVQRGNLESLRPLLALAAQDRSSMASVAQVELKAGRTIDAKLARTLVRLGFVSEIYAVAQSVPLSIHSDWKSRQEELDDQREAASQLKMQTAVAAELEWIRASAPEPQWPSLPGARPPKRRARFGVELEMLDDRKADDVAFELDHAGAASWLELASNLWSERDPQRLCSLLAICWPWTAAANGVGMASDEEAGEQAREWTAVYFHAAVKVAATLRGNAWHSLVFAPLLQLPDDAFLDAAAAALFQVDVLWIDEGRITDEQMLVAREVVVDRLRSTSSWRSLVSRPSNRIEFAIGGALAAVFAGTHELSRGPRCYIPSAHAHRNSVLLPLLTPITQEGGGSTFLAMAFLGLVEVKPRWEHLTFIWTAMAAWWQIQGANPNFWQDHGVGNRVCACTGAALAEAPRSLEAHRQELIGIFDILLRCGIPEAKPLEQRILQALNPK